MNGGTKPPIIVSACLVGLPVRFDGACRGVVAVLALADSCTLVPVCPEQLGGLSTPRAPAEIQGEVAVGEYVAGGDVASIRALVTTKDGSDVSAEFERGARAVADIARLVGAKVAVLKAGSPSCGSGETYDGTFTGTLRSGSGVTAALLEREGVRVFNENDVFADGLSILTGSTQAPAQGEI